MSTSLGALSGTDIGRHVTHCICRLHLAAYAEMSTSLGALSGTDIGGHVPPLQSVFFSFNLARTTFGPPTAPPGSKPAPCRLVKVKGVIVGNEENRFIADTEASTVVISPT
ncbi:hypothetical protein PoB_002226100 [Plakobranchus ocellatus]|uniref:Uncharacterized protein n=1 Tax=Plakobranchus ocellatus TaxID=259542 RepID=A0AAV3ZML0_9GAST|nr:hypothetical protein PoB_002226100 [Plakobranchus ocellatus]